MLTIGTEEPVARAVVEAIHAGDVDAVRRLLDEYPGLAGARLGNPPEGSDPGMTRSLLHVVTDWPGHYPNGAAMVGVLVEAGADVNARFTGPHTETPLHWAASSDDVDVLDALLDAGARHRGARRRHRRRHPPERRRRLRPMAGRPPPRGAGSAHPVPRGGRAGVAGRRRALVRQRRSADPGRHHAGPLVRLSRWTTACRRVSPRTRRRAQLDLEVGRTHSPRCRPTERR